MSDVAANLTLDERAELSQAWDHIQAALRIIERLMGDHDPDPTGLRYSRADEEGPDAPPPLPPGVDGLSLTGRPPRARGVL